MQETENVLYKCDILAAVLYISNVAWFVGVYDCFVINPFLSSVEGFRHCNFPYRSTVRSFLPPVYKSTAIL
jgi:hypothetical protein